MTTAQIIQFPTDRVSVAKQLAQLLEIPAQIIIFPGDRQERLQPMPASPPMNTRCKSRRPD
jgi:hypothetical protein